MNESSPLLQVVAKVTGQEGLLVPDGAAMLKV